jgi:hypothetical protein
MKLKFYEIEGFKTLCALIFLITLSLAIVGGIFYGVYKLSTM